MLWSCQECQSLIRSLISWLNSKNIFLTLVEELFISDVGNTYLSSALQLFMTVKYYIYAANCLNQQL